MSWFPSTAMTLPQDIVTPIPRFSGSTWWAEGGRTEAGPGHLRHLQGAASGTVLPPLPKPDQEIDQRSLPHGLPHSTHNLRAEVQGDL